MKRKLTTLLAAVLLLGLLCGCGASDARKAESGDPGAGSAGAKEQSAFPTGLFMLRYLGDENGEYVPESNEFKDFFNQPTTLLKMMYADNSTIWCEIGEDGTGKLYAPSRDPKTLDFQSGEDGMLLLDGEAVPYRYDPAAGVFWFEEEPRFWDVMEPCSQAKLDLVFSGKGGSVPVAEAEIGDLVCLGQYAQDENAERLLPIYWRVIDKDGDRALLLCDRLLDSFSYNYNPNHEVLTDVTWENCSLRWFLNDREVGFLTMFTGEELALMQTAHLENKAANEELTAQWGSFEDRGEAAYSDLATQDRADDPDTDDTVFLLSYQEVLRYFGEPTEDSGEDPAAAGPGDYPFAVMKVNPAWIATVTDAVHTGYYDAATGGGAWMTRTLCHSHSDEDMVVYISSSGQVFDYFTYVPLFIRPAVWVSTGN